MITLKLTHNKEQWDDLVLEKGGHPLQLWGWGEVKAAHGWTADRLILQDEDDVNHDLGGVQVLTRHLPWPFKSLAYVPRGPIVEPENREELLRLLADYINRNHKSVAISIEPNETDFPLPKGWRVGDNYILPSETIILDLTKTEAELLNDMAKKTRQYIRKSAADGIRIKTVKTREELDKCMAIYHETARRAKFAVHPDQYYYDVFSYLGDNSQIFGAYIGDELVAFVWLIISASTAVELYGGMNEKGQEVRANYALKWHSIKKCKEWGLAHYDFGGLIEGGVSTFKMGWASEPTHLAGTLELPLSKTYGLWNRFLPGGKRVFRAIKKTFRRQ